jgi:hypothetical protein
MKSAVIIIPEALRTQGDALGSAMGWGPVSFTIPVGDPVTHYACRVDVSPAFEAMLADPPDNVVAAFGPVLAALQVDLSESLWGADHLAAVVAGMQ